MRSAVLDSGVRSDGRAAGEVRPIVARAGLLPRAHGSALFTRGETQAVRAFFEFLIFFLSFFLSRVERRSREGRRRGGGSRGGKNLSFLTFKHEKKTSSSPSPRSAPPPRRSASTP